MNEPKTATQKRNARKRAADKKLRAERTALEVLNETEGLGGSWTLEYRELLVEIGICDTNRMVHYRFNPDGSLRDEAQEPAKTNCGQTHNIVYDCPFHFRGDQMPIVELSVKDSYLYNSFDFDVTENVTETIESVTKALADVENCVREGKPYRVTLLDPDGEKRKEWLGRIGLVVVGPADVLAEC